MSSINEKHMAFARALVKLARDNEMGNLNVSFRQSYSVRDEPLSETVHMNWVEGRHGDHSNIVLRAEATLVLSEQSK